MAITHYCLFSGESHSLKGEKYSVKIFSEYKLTGVGNLPMTVDEDRAITLGELTLNYDTSDQDKYSPIIASKLEFEAYVSDTDGGAMEKFCELLRDKWEEGNVTVAIWKDNKEFWAGNMLIDLGDEEDTVPPYAVSLSATDGIGLLKNYDMVETQAANPYDPADTYLSKGYKPITYWLSRMLYKCRTPRSDETSGQWSGYNIDCSVRWAYENQVLGANDCALQWTEIQMLGCYALQDNGLYKCPTVYSVLETICKMFNMRVVYWQSDFFFTQINEFNTGETGTTANPDNIKTTSYDRVGALIGTREAITPDAFFGNYQQNISFGNTGGLQRLSGGNFTYEPQVKRVECVFDSFVGNQAYYQGFPDVWTTAEVNSSTGDQIHTTPLGTHYNASSFGGFICKFPIDITFIDPLGYGTFIINSWTIRARALGTAWSTGKIMKYNATLNPPLVGEWIDYPTSTIDPPNLDVEYDMNVAAPATGINWWWGLGFSIFQSQPAGTYNDYMMLDETINIDAAFVGDWEFEIIMLGRRTVIPGSSTLGYFFQGSNVQLTVPSPVTFWPLDPWLTNGIEYTWVDSMDYSVVPAEYKGLFQPYSSTASNSGATSSITQVYSSRTDTEIKKVEPIIWGDTITYGESNSILFADSTGVSVDGYTDPNGLWAFKHNPSVFDLTITEMICQDRLNNQGISSENMNCTIALSIMNDWDPTIGWELFVTPIGILRDSDTGLTYQFHRGTYNLNTDEVEGEWMQTTRGTVGGTTTTTGGGQPDDPVSSAMMGNPNSRTFDTPMMRWALVRTNAIVSAATITSLPINAYQGPLDFLRAGDRISIPVGNPGVFTFILSADLVRDATTISIESFVLPTDIPKGSSITFNEYDIISQATRQTHGTVGGFEIDTDGIAKGGVEITGWLDSDTMTGATANNVPTAESVKAYVDASGGGAIQNFSFCDCTGTSVTSATNGEANAVVLAFDSEQAESTSNDITLYGSGGVVGIAESAYSWKCDKIAFWQFNWSISTDTNIANNRMVSGVKLQSGIVEGEVMTWTDLDPSHSYIYNRGNGSMREGSTANQFILKQATILSPVYYRLVIWKVSSSTGTTTAITLLNGTNLIIKEI